MPEAVKKATDPDELVSLDDLAGDRCLVGMARNFWDADGQRKTLASQLVGKGLVPAWGIAVEKPGKGSTGWRLYAIRNPLITVGTRITNVAVVPGWLLARMVLW